MSEELAIIEKPRLHQSAAHTLISKSPLHCWYQVFGPPEPPTEATERGELAHALLLGKGKNIHAVHEKTWQKKSAQLLRAELREKGELPVLAWKLDEAVKLAHEVAAYIGTQSILLNGESEKEIEWIANGVRCAGRLDQWTADATILDFKFVRSAAKAACEASMYNYGYDIQYAAYTQGIEHNYPELAGRTRFLFVFVEAEPPHAMRLMPVGGTMRTSGYWRWDRACVLWRECLEKYGTETPWPAYSDDGEPAELPAWALSAQIVDEEVRQQKGIE